LPKNEAKILITIDSSGSSNSILDIDSLREANTKLESIDIVCGTEHTEKLVVHAPELGGLKNLTINQCVHVEIDRTFRPSRELITQ
jgi:hypothetical protein